MTRILVVETAMPQRVRRKVEGILAGSLYPDPHVTILCREDPRTVGYYQAIPGIRVLPIRCRAWGRKPAAVRKGEYDVCLVFWTGEKKYRRMKWLALRLGVGPTDVDSGDGAFFRLNWKTFLRASAFRWRHPLPTDHWQFLPSDEPPPEAAPYPGERILIIQSAEPEHVLRALERLRERSLFDHPRYTLFCRNKPEVIRQFIGHPLISEVCAHTEARSSWKHLRSLRQERFDGLILFLTGDPSYWKVKCFAFLVGARLKLIFNENNDCFYFSWHNWLSLLSHRLGQRSRLGAPPRWMWQARRILFILTKALLLPFRFLWLLGVWLRLRSAAWKAS